MKIVSEKDVKMVDLDIDFEEEEIEMMLEYADDFMPIEELNRLKIEWALIEIIKKAVEEKAE